MASNLSLRPLFMSVCAASFVFASGCAMSPPVAEKMVIAPVGTVMTYHRKSSGGLGTYDGKVVWNMASSTWQGQPVYSFGAAVAGTTLHEPSQFGVVAQLNTAGQPVFSFNPPFSYPWPLEVGKTWTSTHTMTLHASGKTMPIQFTGKVESWGEITVPAGTFKAYKLVWTDSTGDVETRWVNPQEGLATIKRHVDRPATHPLGAGVLDAELISFTVPAK
jgi:hypothetical protein